MRCQYCGTTLDEGEFDNHYQSTASIEEDFGIATIRDIFKNYYNCSSCGFHGMDEKIEETELSLEEYDEYIPQKKANSTG